MNKYLLTIALLCVAGIANAQAYYKSVAPATQNVRVRITFIDASDGSDGTGLGDTEIALYYQREGETISSEFSSGDKAGLDDSHSDGAIGELGTSGVYEIDVPDTAFATASTVYIWGTATGYVCNGATVLVMPTLNVDASGNVTPSNGSITTAKFGTGAITAGVIATDAIGAEELATAGVQEIRNAITGGAYDLDTDANGRIRIVDGTGAGELDTTSGTVLLSSATETQIDDILTDTAEIGTAGAGLTAINGGYAYEFDTTEARLGAIQFRRRDGATNQTPYFTIQDAAGRFLDEGTTNFHDWDTVQSSNWTTYTHALTSAQDAGTANTAYYVHELSTPIPAGVYTVTVYDSTTYNAPVVGYASVYYDATYDNIWTHNGDYSAAAIGDVLTDTGTTLPGTLGTPAGASISADIAAAKADTAAILVDTADIQPKIGTPAGASVSADIAAAKADTAAILVDTADMQPKLGTPTTSLAADIAAVGSGYDYEFASTEARLGAIQFRRVDGDATKTPYFTIQNGDGSFLDVGSTTFDDWDTVQSSNWTDYTHALTSAADAGTSDTPYYIHELSPPIPAGVYTVTIYDSTTYNAPVVGYAQVYYNASYDNIWTPIGDYSADAIAEILTDTSTTLPVAIAAVTSTTQPRINYLPSVKLKLATRNDGAYVCDKPVRVIAGTFDIEKAVGIDCSPFFGRNVQVETVGTCTVSGGSITATGLGPRDEYAMIQLDGTATAGDEVTVDCELTMDNGDKIVARFTIEVGE